MDAARNRSSTRKHRHGGVEVELIEMVFDNILITLTLAWVAMTGTSFLLAYLYRDPNLWRLGAVSSAISFARVAVIAGFTRGNAHAMKERAALRWIDAHCALTLASFTGNAAHTLYNFRHHDSTGKVFWMVGGIILCAGLAGRVTARPRVDQAAIVINMAALMWSVAHSGERFAWIICLMLVMFVYGTCAAVQKRFDMTVEQLRSRRKLRELAEHDALTGLANRRHFEERLATLCNEKQAFAVFFLDLDGFKKINDGHGHATGDALLQHVAKRLQGAVRRSDFAARLGGDEFAVLHAPDATHATASALAERLLECISAPYQIDGLELRIGTSIGIQLSHSGQSGPDTILSLADLALYAVKQTGKGKFHFAETDRSQPRDARKADSLNLLMAPSGCA